MTRPSGPVETKVAAHRWPIAPKAHGAWLGAGAGVGLAQAAVAVIEAITGHPLAPGLVTGIYALSGPLLAFLGAYLAPHQPRPAPPVIKFAETVSDAEAAEIRQRWTAAHPRKPAIGDLRAGAGPGHPAEIFTGPGWEAYQPEPAVQPEATTTGPAAGTGT